jgi:hypothetical protein
MEGVLMPIPEHEIQRLFETGEINSANDAVLQDVMNSLASAQVPNDFVRHREIIRGITINNIRMQRHIDRLDNQNKTTQRWFMLLAGLTLIASIVQTSVALRQPSVGTTQQTTPPKQQPLSSGRAELPTRPPKQQPITSAIPTPAAKAPPATPTRGNVGNVVREGNGI